MSNTIVYPREMNQIINQFDVEQDMMTRLIKDVEFIKISARYISSHYFYDPVSENYTSIIFYYD